MDTLYGSSVFYLDLEFVSEGVWRFEPSIPLLLNFYCNSFNFTSFSGHDIFFQVSGSCVLSILKTLYKHFVLDILPPSVPWST